MADLEHALGRRGGRARGKEGRTSGAKRRSVSPQPLGPCILPRVSTMPTHPTHTSTQQPQTPPPRLLPRDDARQERLLRSMTWSPSVVLSFPVRARGVFLLCVIIVMSSVSAFAAPVSSPSQVLMCLGWPPPTTHHHRKPGSPDQQLYLPVRPTGLVGPFGEGSAVRARQGGLARQAGGFCGLVRLTPPRPHCPCQGNVSAGPAPALRPSLRGKM